MKKLISTILFSTFLFTGCGSSSSGNDTDTTNSQINSKILTIDKSYDKTKLIPFGDGKMGTVYNILILTPAEYYPELVNKDYVTKFLKSKTNLEFIHKTKNNSLEYPIWRIEFPYATQEEMLNIEDILEKTSEINIIEKTTHFLPEFDTPENREMKRNANLL